MVAGKGRVLAMVTLAGLVLVAGCSSPGGPLAEDSGTVSIEADSARAFELAVQGPIRLDYQASVAQGPDIDVFLMDDQNYQSYQSGEEFTYFDCSSLGTGSASGVCELPEGSYHLVLDNTERGEASPATVSTASQTATVDYQFTAQAA